MAGETVGGERLRAARAVALALAVLIGALYVMGVGLYYRGLINGCLQTGCDYGLNFTVGRGDVARIGLSWPVYGLLLVAIEVCYALIYFGVAVLILRRAPANSPALIGAIFLLAWGATNTNPLYALANAVPGLRLFVNLVAFAGGASLYAFCALFPSGKFVPRWTRLTLAAWVVLDLVIELIPSDMPRTKNTWLLAGALLSFLGFFLSMVAAQVYRYRRVSTPAERQQTKWVVYGLAVAIGLLLLNIVVGGLLVPLPQPVALWGLGLHLMTYGATVLIPLSLMAAILQSRLWDIDLLIRRTLVYTGLTAALALDYFASVLLLQWLFTTLTGERRSELVTVLSTLAIAVLFAPVRRRLQAAIDRRFYRQKYDAGRTLAAFAQRLREEVELDRLISDLGSVVEETIQPEFVGVWLNKEQSS